MSKLKPGQRYSQPNGLATDHTSWLSVGMLLGAMLLAVVTTGLFAFLAWNEARNVQRGLETRFATLENRLAQLSAKVEQVGSRAAAPAPRGPDPNHVYTLKLDGAPVRGPQNAPITIAEFSDFQ